MRVSFWYRIESYVEFISYNLRQVVLGSSFCTIVEEQEMCDEDFFLCQRMFDKMLESDLQQWPSAIGIIV